MTTRLNAFLGGYCCCLSAAFPSFEDDGTGPRYVEAVYAAGADDLVAYAKRAKDVELPRLQRAAKEIKRRSKSRRRCSPLEGK